MKTKYLLILSVSLIASCSSNPSKEPTQDLKVTPETMAEAKKAVGYECRTLKQTGSRIGKKVCTTLAQREAAKKRSKDLVNEYRDNNIPVPKVKGQ